jgi:N-methylhydantoinase B
MRRSSDDIDVITVELVKNALHVVALEMQATLVRTAHSHTIREVVDASSSIFDPEGRLVAQALALPNQLGGSSVAIKEILKIFPNATMRPGDVFILNDPFHGGSHAPDIILTMPYFIEGELSGFGCSFAHHRDVGGMSPGSVPPLSTEIYQEGILIPPMRLMDGGAINETLYSMLMANTRLGDELMADIQAQLSSLKVGQADLEAVMKRFGRSTVLAAVDSLLTFTGNAFLKEIEMIPDGVYEFEDYLDDDGFTLGVPIPIRVKITVKGNKLKVDFAGTASQIRGSLNCPVASSLSAVYAVLKVIIDPHDLIPNNEGVYSAFEVSIPKGSLLNPTSPASVSSRPVTQMRIANVIMGALAKVLPKQVMAQDHGQVGLSVLSGTHPQSGKGFVKVEAIAGGWGARHESDGPSALDAIISNVGNTPVEAMEIDFPLMVDRYELVPDSGGAGQYRGGLGVRREVRALVPTDLAVRAERHALAPQGLFGGLSGSPGRWNLIRANGTVETLRCRQAGIKMDPNDVIVTITPGGGGYGLPSDRDPALVAEDLQNGEISIDKAKKDYGTAIVDKALKFMDVHNPTRS